MTWVLFRLLVQAAGVTALISLAAIAIGILIGVAVCGAAMARTPWLRRPARIYVSFFRGVPLLVLLLLCYHLLPAIGLNITGLEAAMLALCLCTAAYQAENLRGGFLSVPAGLKEAGEMVGMSAAQRFRRIEVPIAIRLTIPAMVNEAIAILHASALISVVGVIELTKTARDMSASTFEPLPIYACAGLLYLVLTTWVAGPGLLAERWFQVRA